MKRHAPALFCDSDLPRGLQGILHPFGQGLQQPGLPLQSCTWTSAHIAKAVASRESSEASRERGAHRAKDSVLEILSQLPSLWSEAAW